LIDRASLLPDPLLGQYNLKRANYRRSHRCIIGVQHYGETRRKGILPKTWGALQYSCWRCQNVRYNEKERTAIPHPICTDSARKWPRADEATAAKREQFGFHSKWAGIPKKERSNSLHFSSEWPVEKRSGKSTHEKLLFFVPLLIVVLLGALSGHIIFLL